MSGEWMKEFRRSASEKLRSPSAGSALTSATESLTRSIKQSFHAGFLSRSFNVETTDDSQRVACESASISQENVPVQPCGPFTLRDKSASGPVPVSSAARSVSLSTDSATRAAVATVASEATAPTMSSNASVAGVAMTKEPLRAVESTGSCPSFSSPTSNPLTAFIFRRTPLSTKRSFDSSSQMGPAMRTDSIASSGEQHTLTHQKSTSSASGSIALNLGGSLIHYPASSALHKISSSVTSLARAATGSSSSEMDDSPTAAGGKFVNSPRAIGKAEASASLSSSSMSHSPPTMISAGEVTGGTPSSSGASVSTPPLVVTAGARAKAGWTRALNGTASRGSKREKKKSSLGLLDTSSSEDELEDTCTDLPSATRQRSTSTDDGSTPSPRTPNSFKILSGIDKNQATAFEFPPSPFASRHPSYERSGTHSERQSSDEFSTTVSSFRSRSTSSEVFEDAVGVAASSSVSSGCSSVFPSLTPIAQVVANRMNRRGLSPLKKQAAIAEEIANSLVACDHHQTGSSTSSHSSAHLSSIGDSGLSDCPRTPPLCYKSSPAFVNSPSHKHSPSLYRSRSRLSETTSSSKSDSQTAFNSSETQVVSSPASVSVSLSDDNDDASILFRKVTIRKRLAPIPPPPSTYTRCLSAEPSDCPREFPRPSSEPLRPCFIHQGEMHPLFVLNKPTNHSAYDDECKGNLYRQLTCIIGFDEKNITHCTATHRAEANERANNESMRDATSSLKDNENNCPIVEASKWRSETDRDCLLMTSTHENTRGKHLDKLRVKSHLTTFDGVTYIEDSDWEIYSDSEWSNSQSVSSTIDKRTRARQSNKMKDSPWSSVSSLNTSCSLFSPSLHHLSTRTKATLSTLAPCTSTQSISSHASIASSLIDLRGAGKCAPLSIALDGDTIQNAFIHPNDESVASIPTKNTSHACTSLKLSPNSIDAPIMSQRQDKRCASAPAVLFNVADVHRQQPIRSYVSLSVSQSTDRCIDDEYEDAHNDQVSRERRECAKYSESMEQKVYQREASDYASLSRQMDSSSDTWIELIDSHRHVMRDDFHARDMWMMEKGLKDKLIGTFNPTKRQIERGKCAFGDATDSAEWTGTSKVTLSRHESSTLATARECLVDEYTFSPDDQCTPTREMKIMSDELNKQKANANNHKRTHVLNFECEGGKVHLQDQLNHEWRHLCLKENLLHESEEEGKSKKVDEKKRVKVHNEIIQHTSYKPHAHDHRVTLPLELIELFANCFASLDSSCRAQSADASTDHYHRSESSSHCDDKSTFRRLSCSCTLCYHCFPCVRCIFIAHKSTLASQLDDAATFLQLTSLQHSPSHLVAGECSIHHEHPNVSESALSSHSPTTLDICPCRHSALQLFHLESTIDSSDSQLICIESKSRPINDITLCVCCCTIDRLSKDTSDKTSNSISNKRQDKVHHYISCVHLPQHLQVHLIVKFNSCDSRFEMQTESHRIVLKLGNDASSERVGPVGQVARKVDAVKLAHCNIAASCPLKWHEKDVFTQLADSRAYINPKFKLQRSVTKVHISPEKLDAIQGPESSASVKKSSSSPSLLSSYNQHMIHVQVKHRCSNRLTTLHAPLSSLPRGYFRPQSVNCIVKSPSPPAAPSSAPVSTLLPVSANNSHQVYSDICIADPSFLHSLPRSRITEQNALNDKADVRFSSPSSMQNVQFNGEIDNSIESTAPHASAKGFSFASLINSADRSTIHSNVYHSDGLTLYDVHGNEETIWTRHSRSNSASHPIATITQQQQQQQQQQQRQQVSQLRTQSTHNDTSLTNADNNLKNKSFSLPRNHYQRRQRQPDTQERAPSDACLPVCHDALPPGEEKGNSLQCHEASRKVISSTMSEGDSHDLQKVDNDASTKLVKQHLAQEHVTAATLTPSVTLHRDDEGRANSQSQHKSEGGRMHSHVPVACVSEADRQTNNPHNSFTLPFRGVNSICESRTTGEYTPPRVNNELTVLSERRGHESGHSHTTKEHFCPVNSGHQCHTSQRRHSNDAVNNGIHFSTCDSSFSASHPFSHHIDVSECDGDREKEANDALSTSSSPSADENNCDDDQEEEREQEEREDEEIQETTWQIRKHNCTHVSRGKLVNNALMQLRINDNINISSDQCKSQQICLSSDRNHIEAHETSEQTESMPYERQIAVTDSPSKCANDANCDDRHEQGKSLKQSPRHRVSNIDDNIDDNTTQETVASREYSQQEEDSALSRVNSPFCVYDVTNDKQNTTRSNIAQGEREDIVIDDTVDSDAREKGDRDKGEGTQRESDTSHRMNTKDAREMVVSDEERADETNEYPVRQEKEEVSEGLVTELTMHLTGRNVAAAAAAATCAHPKLQNEWSQYEQCIAKERQLERLQRLQHSPANEIDSVNEVNSDCLQLTRQQSNCSHHSDEASVTQQQQEQRQRHRYQAHVDVCVKRNQPFNSLPTDCLIDTPHNSQLNNSEICAHRNEQNNGVHAGSRVNIRANNTNHQPIVTEVTSDAIWHKSLSPLAPCVSLSFSCEPTITAVDSPSSSSSSCATSPLASHLSGTRETKQIVPVSGDSVSPGQSTSSPLGHRLLTPTTGDFVSHQSSESITRSVDLSYSYPEQCYPVDRVTRDAPINSSSSPHSCDISNGPLNVTQKCPGQVNATQDEKSTAQDKHCASPRFVISFSNLLSKQIVSSILHSFSLTSNQRKHSSQLCVSPNWLPEDKATRCSLAASDDVTFAPKPPPRTHRKQRKSRDFLHQTQCSSCLGVSPAASVHLLGHIAHHSPSERAPVNCICVTNLPSDTVSEGNKVSYSRDTVNSSCLALGDTSNAPVSRVTQCVARIASSMPAGDKATKSRRQLDTALAKQMSCVSDGTTLDTQCNSSIAGDSLKSPHAYADMQSVLNASVASRVQRKTCEKVMGEEAVNSKRNNQSLEATDASASSLYPFSDDEGDTEDPVLLDLCQDESGNYYSEASPTHHQFNLYYANDDNDVANNTINMNTIETINNPPFDDLADYGNPFSYSLHTIVEESERSCDEGDDCEAKHRLSLCSTSPNEPLNSAPIADSTDVAPDEIFKVAKRISNSLTESLQASDIETSSNSESECESHAQSPVKCNFNPCNLVNESHCKRHSSHLHPHHRNHRNNLSSQSAPDDADPVIVTSSRLEDYFTFALLSDVESGHNVKDSSGKVKPRGQPTVQRVVTVNQFDDSNSHSSNDSSSRMHNATVDTFDSSDEKSYPKVQSSSSSNDLNNSTSPATCSSSSPSSSPSCDIESPSSSVHQSQLSQVPKVIHCIEANVTMSNNEDAAEKLKYVESEASLNVKNKKQAQAEQVKEEEKQQEEQVNETKDETAVKQRESCVTQVKPPVIMKQEDRVESNDAHADASDARSKFLMETETNVDRVEEQLDAEKVDNIDSRGKSCVPPLAPTDTPDGQSKTSESSTINSHLQCDVKDKRETHTKSNSLHTVKPEKSICMQSECTVKRIPSICRVNLMPSSASASSSPPVLAPSTPLLVAPASSSHSVHETVNSVTMTNVSISSRTHSVSNALESHCRNIISGASDVWKKFKDDGLGNSPHRLRGRTKGQIGESQVSSGTSTSGLPQISVSDYSANASCRSLCSSSDLDHHQQDDGTSTHESKSSSVFPFQSSSSLSSIGIRSESLSSLFSSSGYRYGTVAVSGEILFGLTFSAVDGYLEVTIKECRNLAAVDMKRNRSDPFVKVYLLPDRSRSGKRKTKVCKSTLNPVFNEKVRFNLTMGQVEGRSVWLTVWHSDRFGRNDFLGEVTLPLGHSVFDHTDLKWFPLQDKMEQEEATSIGTKGSLFIALKFVPMDTASRASISCLARGELHVLIKEGHDLTCTRGVNCNPFCKSYFLPDRSRTSKQKTPACKKTLNPKWNHTIVYEELTLADLKSRCIELTLWDYDKLSANEFLGGVRLSLGTSNCEGRLVDWMDSQGPEVTIWQQMLNRPGMWAYGEVKLRSSMRCLKTI